MVDNRDENTDVLRRLLDYLLTIVDRLSFIPDRVVYLEKELRDIHEIVNHVFVRSEEIDKKLSDACSKLGVNVNNLEDLVRVMEKNNEHLTQWLAIITEEKEEKKRCRETQDAEIKLKIVRWDIIGKVLTVTLSGGGVIFILLEWLLSH